MTKLLLLACGLYLRHDSALLEVAEEALDWRSIVGVRSREDDRHFQTL